MHDIRLTRDEQTVPGNVLVITPMGKKVLRNDDEFDFDWHFQDVISPVVTETGMTPVRADSVYGPANVLDVVWRGIQQAEVCIVDFSCRTPNVAMEYMAAKLIGKRMIYLAQHADDIPSDVRGLRHIPYTPLYADMARMRAELRQQLEAVRLEPGQEMALIPLVTGGVTPARAQVVSVSAEFAVVRAVDGTLGVLSGEDVDWSRIVTDMARFCTVGEWLDGAFEMLPAGGTKYTLLSGQQNPWRRLEATQPAGHTFTGTVHSVRQAGVFVRVSGPVNGLVPRSSLPPGTELTPGSQVEVTVLSVESRRRRVTLALVQGGARGRGRPVVPLPSTGATSAGGPAGAATAGVTLHERLEGEVVKIAPEGQGGYVLLRVPGRERPVFLHCLAMSGQLRHDLNHDGIELGEILDVEVSSIDLRQNKVCVRDVEPEDEDTVAPEEDGAQGLPQAA
ncbi:S1 RNA-binding domain-containing protein [Streptomyces sp. NPDC005803]|uniref:S1 RNA-binding domain-containing protein n=1 Tax=Streptomyces sp. NPDC005803 TaxID=3154297 RepID=UPI0033EB206E